jgi:hypothetical protein
MRSDDEDSAVSESESSESSEEEQEQSNAKYVLHLLSFEWCGVIMLFLTDMERVDCRKKY